MVKKLYAFLNSEKRIFFDSGDGRGIPGQVEKRQDQYYFKPETPGEEIPELIPLTANWKNRVAFNRLGFLEKRIRK